MKRVLVLAMVVIILHDGYDFPTKTAPFLFPLQKYREKKQAYFVEGNNARQICQ